MTQDSTCVTFIGKVVCICLRVSVNLVYKFQGKPGTTTVKHDFNPNGLKFHRGSPWVSILSWLNLKANKDYFSYEHDWFQSCHTYRDRYEVSCIRLFRKCASMSVCETWLIHMCDMTHSNVWHDSRLYICDMTYSNVRCKWIFRTCTSMSTCETWLIHMCNMTHSYVWHDSFIRVTRLIHMCDMTHSYVWHDSFIRVTRLIHMCDMTHSYVWHDSFIRVTRLTTLHSWHDLFRGIRDTTCSEVCRTLHTAVLDMRVNVSLWDVTHSHVWHDSWLYLWLALFIRTLQTNVSDMRVHVNLKFHKSQLYSHFVW